MKKKFTEIFQYISISYTIIIIISSTLSLSQYGIQTAINAKFLLEVFLLLCVCWIVETPLNKITILQNMNEKTQILLYMVFEYFIYFGFVKIFGWFAVSMKNIIFYTAIFIILEFLIRSVYYHKWKAEEDVLNQLIRKNNQKG